MLKLVSALALAGALAGTLAGSAALAQSSPPPAPPGMHRGWDPAAMRDHMMQRRAEHMKALHAALNIRPDQEGAWSAFTAAMTPPDRSGQWERMKGERGAMANLTTPERLDRMAQMMDRRTAERRDRFQRMASATKALYAALGPDQRRTFDALPHLMMGHGMGHGGKGGHGMGGHGGPGGPGGHMGPPPPQGE